MKHLYHRGSERSFAKPDRLARFNTINTSFADVSEADSIELEYEFDFSESDSVLYTGNAGPFPGRVFLLRFWRHAKDGVMHLLGYEKQGHWRDPTLCYPNSFVRYYKPNHREPHDREPQDRDSGIDRLASRPVLVELEPGMYEVPNSLARLPMRRASALTAGVVPVKRAVATRQAAEPKKPPLPKRPPLNTPIQKNILFGGFSTHFRNPAQAEEVLAGIVKVLKQFPELHITLEGSMDGPRDLDPKLRGRGPAARAYQNAPNVMKSIGGAETFNSLGHFMDARVQAIKRHLVSKGISPERITCTRGEIYPEQATKRKVTVIFSNP
ncbi:hypothetical protein [Hymenobacter cellulosilyticus]|uniref:OmpA-like domain-containing protein n=1 Tax=Hymenobacter cellulosilyticus TaxID=2932248 RepID=A0A8T9QDB5_9BACT|nr:hypothetical protein [Hymenobacter cellulosilyticus]UOQ73559.1 hypothetical protein MUN79_06410 [Hymenobacter cellulosilyticus]